MEHEQRAREIVSQGAFGKWEEKAAQDGSGLTREQMTGVSIALLWAEPRILAALQQVERETIERCATVCDAQVRQSLEDIDYTGGHAVTAARHCAKAIRALGQERGGERGGYSATQQE